MIRIGPVFAILGALWSGIPDAVEWVGIISDARAALMSVSAPPEHDLVAGVTQ